MNVNQQANKDTSFVVTAEFTLTNKQVVIGIISLGRHDSIVDYLNKADSFISIADRKKKNPDTVLRTKEIVTVRELDRKEIATKKLNL
ncbi:MAG: hypothetical protein HQL69_03890 [Magnetococcales bacterium]|nr:hypothetical protein [Magnetococcales bacterium]